MLLSLFPFPFLWVSYFGSHTDFVVGVGDDASCPAALRPWNIRVAAAAAAASLIAKCWCCYLRNVGPPMGTVAKVTSCIYRSGFLFFCEERGET